MSNVLNTLNLFGYSAVTGEPMPQWWGRYQPTMAELWNDDSEGVNPSHQSQRAPKKRKVEKEWQVTVLEVIPANDELEEPAYLAIKSKFALKPERKFKAKPVKKVTKTFLGNDEYRLIHKF